VKEVGRIKADTIDEVDVHVMCCSHSRCLSTPARGKAALG
jgi:hypothetical protein